MSRIAAAAAAVLLLLGVPAGALAGATDDVAEADRLSDSGRFEEAIALYTRAIDSGELGGYKLAAAYYSRGLSRGRMGNNEQAVQDYTAALAADPSLVAAWSSLCYQRSRDKTQLDAALEACKRALALDPKHGPSLGIRAEVWGLKGNLAAAERDYAEAIRLAPDNWALYFNRGVLYHREGRDAEARPDFAAAYELAPAWAREHPTAIKMFDRYGLSGQQNQKRQK